MITDDLRKKPHPKMNRYTRKEVAKTCGVHPNTIYRLEKAGKLPLLPVRLKHNGELIYRDEHIEALNKYLLEEEELTSAPVEMAG